jgi:hypothetical protein
VRVVSRCKCGKPAMPVTNGETLRQCLDCWKAQQVQRVVGDLDMLR